MSGVTARAGIGHVVAGEMDVTFRPRGGPRGKRPVCLLHGQLRTASDWVDTAAWPGSARLARSLAQAGLLVVAALWKGPAWDNQAFRDSIEAFRTYAATLGAGADGFIAIGASMGAFEMLGLGQHVPNEMKAGVGLIPAVNLDYFRDNDVAGARANINTAYGLAAGSTSATVPLPADANPFVPANAALITPPVKLYGSSGDATAPWVDAVTMAGRMPNCTATDVLPGGGHTDATIQAAPVGEIVDFVLAHA